MQESTRRSWNVYVLKIKTGNYLEDRHVEGGL